MNRGDAPSPTLLPLITYICRCSGHRSNAHGDPPYIVTLYQHEWAFCGCSEIDGHDWARIQPSTIDEIVSKRRNGLDLATTD